MHPAMIHGYADVLVRLGMQKEADELLKRAAGPLGAGAVAAPTPRPAALAPQARPQAPGVANAASLGQPKAKPPAPALAASSGPSAAAKAQAKSYANMIPAPPSIPGM
jgi:hypothetical protein